MTPASNAPGARSTPASDPAIDAVVFAGGLGTRLRAAVADRPKVLADVRGRPFLSYLLDQLAAAGIERAILCTGYMAEQVEAAFGAAHGALRLVYSREATPMGTGGALRLALDRVRTDPVLVLNGDSYCGVDLRALLAAHRASRARATMLLTEVEDVARYGVVRTTADGRVESFVEKGGARGPGWINAGVYVLPRAEIAALPADRPVSLERELLPRLVDAGLAGHRAPGPFLDIGTPESYAAAERFFARGRPTDPE